MKVTFAIFALISSSSAVKLEREPLRAWSPTPKADGFKMNYKVPHFGTDSDINNSLDSTKLAEAQHGHVW